MFEAGDHLGDELQPAAAASESYDDGTDKSNGV
jgi:hypothetical protein